MNKFIPTRKQIDEYIILWENQHDKGEQKQSLEMFIRTKTALWIFSGLKEDKIITQDLFDKVQEELKVFVD